MKVSAGSLIAHAIGNDHAISQFCEVVKFSVQSAALFGVANSISNIFKRPIATTHELLAFVAIIAAVLFAFYVDRQKYIYFPPTTI